MKMSHGRPFEPAVSLDPGDADWAAAIARGTPPFERLRHPAFEADGSGPSGEEAARQWIAATCSAAPHRQAELLAVLDVDAAAAMQAFRPARIAADGPLPGWACCLIRTVRALPAEHRSADGRDPTDTGIGAFLEAARLLLDWDRLTARHPFLDSGVLPALTRQLVTRILLACGATLELENVTRTAPVWEFGRTAWMDRLCGFSGLNFVVGTAIRQWRQNALEMLSRIASDLPMLEQAVFAGARAGALLSIEGDLGDRHNDGRSVAVLTFASGARIVYKPKDLRCARQFMGLLDALNAAGPALPLPTRTIVCRGDYSWEQHVGQRQTESVAEAARFFRRFGMMLRVLQIVEGRDFWIDNLRADGDRPVFVDLECILHPRAATPDRRDSVMGLDPESYEESVLATAAVTQPIDVAGFGLQDFGALSSSGFRALPLGMWKGYRDQGNGNIWLRGGRLYWAPDVAWPLVNGQPAAAADFLAELETGYREVQQLLCRCAAGLLGPASALTGIGAVPVRVLMRSTWEYLVLLRASLEPNALLDGNARELALTSVVSTAPDWSGEAGACWRLARSELDALRLLDIPEFWNLPSGTAAMDPSHLAVPRVFAGSSHERMQARLVNVGSFDTERHVAILRAAVGSMARPLVAA